MNRRGLYFALSFAAIVSLLVTAGELVARKPALDAQPVEKTLMNRTNKGDRLASARPGAEPMEKIAVVEVIGVRDVAIIYRNRTGEVVFFTDPVNNITAVAKGVELPEVTIRETAKRAPEPVLIDNLRDNERPRALHPGCLPDVSPADVSPAYAPALSHRAASCIADVTNWNMAANGR